jgi:hypothetical protein
MQYRLERSDLAVKLDPLVLQDSIAGLFGSLLDRVARQTRAHCDLAEGELVTQPHASDLANHIHGDHLASLLKFSAGQWKTLVNIGLVLCGLAVQNCVGTNKRSSRSFSL